MADSFSWVGTQHAQFQGLLADLRMNPEDTGLRLILADWIEEHVDLLEVEERESVLAWSRVLRLQCAREKSRGGATSEENELLRGHSRRWLESLNDREIRVEWRLGFLKLGGNVVDLYQAIRECDEAVFTRVLWLEPGGAAPARGRHLESLLSLPQLSGLSTLNLSQLAGLSAPVALALARSRPLAGLCHLVARGVGFRTAEFQCLAESSSRTLQSLDLGYNSGGDEGVYALADSPICESLRVLRLQRVEMTDAGAEALLGSPHLRNLREISLYGNRLSPAMANRLEARFGLGFSW